MLDKLLSLIPGELGISHLADILGDIVSLLEKIGPNYMKDGNFTDAAIDTICQILQAHKQNPVVK